MRRPDGLRRLPAANSRHCLVSVGHSVTLASIRTESYHRRHAVLRHLQRGDQIAAALFAAWAVTIALLINLATAPPAHAQMAAVRFGRIWRPRLCPFDMGGGSSVASRPKPRRLSTTNMSHLPGGIGTAILDRHFQLRPLSHGHDCRGRTTNCLRVTSISHGIHIGAPPLAI